MKQKQLMILLAALVLLVGVALFVGVFDRAASTVDVPDVHIPVDRVHSLRIDGSGGTIALAREGARWRLTEPVTAPADSMTIDQLLREIEGLRLGTVVSTNPERYARFGVDTTAPSLTIVGPHREWRLIVGQPGPDFRSVNVRLDGDPRVFTTRERISVPTDLDRFRDKTIVHLSRSEVARAEFTSPGGSFMLEPGDTSWNLVSGDRSVAADSSSVYRWLNRLAPLRADGFLMDEDPSAVRDSTTHRMRVETATGAVVDLRIRQREGDSNVAAIIDDEVVYRIQDYRISQLVPEHESLAAP